MTIKTLNSFSDALSIGPECDTPVSSVSANAAMSAGLIDNRRSAVNRNDLTGNKGSRW